MNKQTPEISLLFGGLGLLFIIFAALETAFDILLPTLIFVLFHAVMVLTAFPFFLYTMFYHDSISKFYFWTVAIMSAINATLMLIVSTIDPQISNLFYVAAYLEFLPLPFLLMSKDHIREDTNLNNFENVSEVTT